MPATPSLDELIQVRAVSDVHLAPDGRRVVFTVTRPVMTSDKSEYITHIYSSDGGSGVAQRTFGRSSCRNPQWSPDGEWIGFASSRSGKSNLHLLHFASGETRQLTDIETGVGPFRWSPDGKWIAFVMPDAPTPSEKRAEEEKNDARVVDENFKMNRLWVISVEDEGRGGHRPRPLTGGDLNVGSCFGGRMFDWSPDGRRIAFTLTPTPRTDDWASAEIASVEVDTGAIQSLLPVKGAGAPLYSPDGHWVAFQAGTGPPSWASTPDVFVAPAAGGRYRLVAETFERWPELVDWSADSRTVYYTDSRGTATGLFSVSLEGGSPRQLDRGDMVMSSVSLNPSRSMVGFVAQSTTRPAEVYVTSLDRFTPAQISHVNGHMAAIPSSRTEVIRYESSDGLGIEGLLTYPAEYEAGKCCPLLLIVHGGPMDMFTRTFTTGLDPDNPYPLAAFSARGYAVLRCNVRGSSGYGKKFIQANYRDWGGGDYEDLMKGVDFVIDMGVADATRLGVMGWSYGGYLTAWTITRTRRFKAASVGAGPVNLVSDAGTSDIPTCITDYLGAEFWDDLDIYLERSPIFHVKGVSTPTLIQHFEEDDVVPISQGYEFYRALKRRGVPVKMIAYPRTPHGLTEPKLLLDFARRNLEWFDRYLQP